MTARVLPFRRSDPAPQKRLNLRDICDIYCLSCCQSWVAPVPVSGPVDCARCHGIGTASVVVGSIRRENAVRVN